MEEVAGAETNEFLIAQAALSQMIREGEKSFSGYERNCCFLNLGEGEFATVSAVSGLDLIDDSRAVASVDWDHDGDLDLFVNGRNSPQVHFLRNESKLTNHFVSLKLTGSSCNRDAIGARVELYRNGEETPLIKTVRAGSGLLSQSSKWLHFGLGDCQKIDRIVVQWPEGQSETLTGLKCNSRYRVVEGSNAAELWLPPSDRVVQLEPSIPQSPTFCAASRVICSTSVHLPVLPFTSFDGERLSVADFHGKTVLLNLWASWCGPCVQELTEFSHRADILKAAGVEVVAISVDGIGSDDSSPEQARDLLSRINFPFSAGSASEELLDKLEILRGELFNKAKPFPLPTSFLIDEEGRLAIIYQGSIEVDSLLSDLNILESSDVERREAGTPIAGRWFSPPQQVNMRKLVYAFRNAGYEKDARFFDQKAIVQQASQIHNAGLDLLKMGRFSDAATCFSQAIEKDPECAPAHQNLGITLLQIGKFVEAEHFLREAIRLDVRQKEAHLYLGNSLALQNNFASALECYEEAVRLDSEFAFAHAAVGSLYASQLGNLEKAEANFVRAVQLQPDQTDWLFDLGTVLFQLHKFAEAAERFRQASQLDSDNPKFHLSLAESLIAAGKPAEALESYRAVLQADFQNRQAGLQLAWYLSTLPNGSLRNAEEAIDRAERIAKKFGDHDPASLDVLAAAYAAAGRFEEAAQTAKKALTIASELGNREHNEIQDRLNLYLEKKPYRLPPAQVTVLYEFGS